MANTLNFNNSPKYKTNTWSTLTKNEVFVSKKLIQLLQNDKL